MNCPHCNSSSIVKIGIRQTKTGMHQRYRCKECCKIFTETSRTVMSRSRKSIEIWKIFIDSMLLGLSLSEQAELCGINRITAFHWRHKILDAVQLKEQTKLKGIIEADETFFPTSYKGNHHTFRIPRKSHHRGGESRLHGISSDKVCVACAIDRTGTAIAKIANLARIKTESLNQIYRNKIELGATIITDKASAYRKFAETNGIKLIQLKNKENNRAGKYNTQAINAFHSALKRFMQRFNGVSSKYLNNYLSLFCLARAKGEISTKRNQIIAFLLQTPFYETCKQITLRSPMPIYA